MQMYGPMERSLSQVLTIVPGSNGEYVQRIMTTVLANCAKDFKTLDDEVERLCRIGDRQAAENLKAKAIAVCTRAVEEALGIEQSEGSSEDESGTSAASEEVEEEEDDRHVRRSSRRFNCRLREVAQSESPARKRRKISNYLEETSVLPVKEAINPATMPTKEEEHAALKVHLAITPKTINMLYNSGYTTPASLRNATPNEVAAKFATRPGMDWKKAKDYVRPLRRMVMLGDIEDRATAVATARKLQKWSKVELVRLGVWEEAFDDLTGAEIHRKMRGAGALP